MGFNSVYRALMEIFPQIDARILKAVAIEHSKDADVAVEVVLSEIVPCLPPTSAVNGTQPQDKVPKSISDGEEHEMDNGQLRHRRACAVSRSNPGASSLGTKSLAVEHGGDSSLTRAAYDESSAHLNKGSNVSSSGGCYTFSGHTGSEELVSLGKAPEKDVDVRVSQIDPMFNASAHKDYGYDNFLERCFSTQTKKPVQLGESEDYSTKATSSEISHVAPSAFMQENTNKSSNGCGGFDDPLYDDFDTSNHGKHDQAESSTIENAMVQLVDSNALEQPSDTQKCYPSLEFGSGSLHSDCETSKGSIISEKGDVKDNAALNTIVTRSGQVCSIDLLEEIIEDAKSNKKTLFTVMESVMDLMREVELQEKVSEQAKEEAAGGGCDIIKQVEDLKQMLAHAKEANDMHAGEVYGEKAILATELKELQTRLLNLSEERNKSLAILDEMRETLEARLAAADEMRKAAEKEKQEKEESARKALSEQEAIMEKVVQESKILQQEAEENSKLREFLMDRGRVVDSLQGEISVICQDVRLLKEKFDERVPLSKSISSSQTSCRLASSGSSLKSLALDIATEPPREILRMLDQKSPISSNNGESPSIKLRGDVKGLLDDGWDIFDKEAELLRQEV